MTPAARVAAAIECLDMVIAAARTGGAAADTLVQRYFATRRYAGSKDRRAVRDLVFGVIRAFGDPPVSGRAAITGYARMAPADAARAALLDAFGEAGHAPAALQADEAMAVPSLAPAWQLKLLGQRFGKDIIAAVTPLLGRAPLDLRVNTLLTSRDAVRAELPDLAPLALDGDALRAPEGTAIDTLPAFNQGRIEVQDAGSQVAARATGAQPGELVIDLCAGAGGKTLALAAQMANRGRLIATDTDRGRLEAMIPRLARAGVAIVTRRLLDPGKEADALADLAGAADRVLVDAPCSGTGTWRRNPEARWRLTEARLARLTAEQDRLLGVAAALVRPGGSLTYVVCSLLPGEAEARVAAFLTAHPDFARLAFRNPRDGADVTELVLTPGIDGCDGFYIARLVRVC